MAKFFIERPVLANVIAIITVLMGTVAALYLPIEQFPEVTPPTIQIRATYPGANATVLAETVAAPIEQQVNGVEDMLYMSSSSSSDGSYSLTVTFEIGTDLDEAQVLVQNRVSIAEPTLPEEVRRQGVTVKKQSPSILFVISLFSENPEIDSLYLSNFANLRLRDELSRVNGVGEVQIFGVSNYSMRIWLDAAKLKARDMTAGDVIAALREQNVQVAAGQVGQPPTPEGSQFQYTVNVLGRLTDQEQFENIIVKTADRRIVYLKDVARVELGSQSYDQFTEMRGQGNANIGIYQLPGANALQVAEDVQDTMERLAERFPADVQYDIPFDTTDFVDESVKEVYKTMAEAGALVLLVIMIFLQDWRALLIPATTVPVTIIGAFAAMYVLGFSINTLTLFGLILAIAIVVDDAIVVVENVVHHIERGEPPKTATIRAMSEVLAPIMGITMVLMAVFIPASLLGGITGQLYRQFALTIAATALISAVNAVTLKPTQSALWLRPIDKNRKKWFFYRWFDAVYGVIERVYIAVVRYVFIDHPILTGIAFLWLVGLTGWLYFQQPTGFFPVEDQGYAIASVQLPDAASLNRTREVLGEVDTILSETPGVSSWITIGGLSLLQGSSAPNSGTIFITFEPWDQRYEEGNTQQEILGTIGGRFAAIQEAQVMAFPPPAIRGLGFQGGFEMQLEDVSGAGLEQLGKVADEIVAAAAGQSSLALVNTAFRPGVPQVFVDVDRVKAKSLNIPLETVFGTLQAYLGSAYVNDFNKFGRVYQVRVQAEAEDRAQVEDIERLEVRNAAGEMIPLGSVVTVRRDYGPSVIKRYNLYPSAAITGSAAPGVSSGDALRIMEQLAGQTLPQSMAYEWTGMSFQEKKVGNEAAFVFGFGVLLIYFVLAAQYESWILPISVILVVPLGLLGTVLAGMLRGLDINIYTQVGILLIIALASKNAILVVEFARDLRLAGESIHDAAVGAARMRFRPIIMTSLAFILGVLPLVFAQGAGAASRQALGTAVVGGMITATVLSVFFVPVFYIIFQSLDELFRGPRTRPVQIEKETPREEPVLVH